MNDGYHYYFGLSEKQNEILKDFTAKTATTDKNNKVNGLWGLWIDIKYNNQVFFGPTILNADKEYKYQLLMEVEPSILPDFIFDGK